nr:TIGR03086 family metal-binding protein [Streptomyces albus]
MHAENESGTNATDPTDTTGPAVPDLGPAARRVARLLDGITDDHLSAPTPCPEYAVRDLLQHLVGLTAAFRDAAEKRLGPSTATDPGSAGPGPLAEDWRHRLPRQLGELVTAWHRPEAWEGQTQAGGVTLPGQVAGVVALNELVVHGWDLARATGQEYTADEESARACVELMAPADPSGTEGLFGPVVDVPDGAPVLDRVIGLSGRSPSWTPPAMG